MTPEDFFRDHAFGLSLFEKVLAVLSHHGRVEVRTSRSQVAFRRRRGFAYLWLPDMYLGDRAAGIVVLSFALGRREDSPRFKQVTQVAPAHWMHHLEIRDPSAIDEQIVAWLHEAAARAG